VDRTTSNEQRTKDAIGIDGAMNPRPTRDAVPTRWRDESAPYGEPHFMTEMRRIVALESDGSYRLNLKYFRHHREKIAYEWEGGEPAFEDLYSPAIEELLGPARREGQQLMQRHKDITRFVQAMYEETFFHLLNRLHDRYGLDSLVLAGGCAMNSVANGKILRNAPFKRFYVQSAAGDAGGAIGAELASGARERPLSRTAGLR
jgi:carbamoyltransferase